MVRSEIDDDALNSLSFESQVLYLRGLRPAAKMLNGKLPIGTTIPWYELAHVLDGCHTREDPQTRIQRCLDELETAGLVRQWWGASLPGQERGLLVEVLTLESQDAA